MFFLTTIFFFFFENRQNLNVRAEQKKTTWFLGNVRRPKSNARAHLKQRKKLSGLREKRGAVCGKRLTLLHTIP